MSRAHKPFSELLWSLLHREEQLFFHPSDEPLSLGTGLNGKAALSWLRPLHFSETGPLLIGGYCFHIERAFGG
jgi:hypothetical protein